MHSEGSHKTYTVPGQYRHRIFLMKLIADIVVLFFASSNLTEYKLLKQAFISEY